MTAMACVTMLTLEVVNKALFTRISYKISMLLKNENWLQLRVQSINRYIICNSDFIDFENWYIPRTIARNTVIFIIMSNDVIA